MSGAGQKDPQDQKDQIFGSKGYYCNKETRAC